MENARAVFAAALNNLYPTDGKIYAAAVARVIDVQRKAGLIAADKQFPPEQGFTNQFVQGG